MNIANIAADIFMKKTGGSGDISNIASAFTGLLGDSGGDIDIMGLISKFQSGGLTSIVSSWLGDTGNDGVSTEQITNVLGESGISEFASKVGVDSDTAVNGLKETIPSVIDQFSNGGSLLESVGGLGGALDMAKKLF